ncbi:MAG: ABC transporter permease [Deltaproteobacteria bacterium]|nr:ABC transporter permease [Deltaproteobacteria bacterium]
MIQYVIKRLGWAIFVVAVVAVLVFLLMNRVGAPAVATLGPNAGPQQIQDFKRKNGLDQPLAVQFAAYLGVVPCVRQGSRAFKDHPDDPGYCGLLQGDLGDSFTHNEPVARVIAHRLPRTLLLGVLAIFFEIFLGVSVGILAAVKRNTWFDTGFMATAFLGISLPTYVTGPIFLLVFAFFFGWFPVGGYGEGFWDHVYHGILPAFTLAIVGAATYARITRSEMIETLRSDYIRTAKAKGLGPSTIVVKHGLRNALLPLVTLLGLDLSLLVAGAIITENIFAWPGMGALAIQSIVGLDAPTVMGVVLVFSAMVQVGNLLADLAIAALDPRVRLGNEPS